MGVIWLQRTDGRLIHLPIVGEDFNTPDDAIKIPTAVVVDRNRCFSGQIQIVSPTYGSFTLDFTEPGRTGECNQCGQCCIHPVDVCQNPGTCAWPLREFNKFPSVHACPNLIIINNNKWGEPGNTECSIYTDLIDITKGCMYPPYQSDIKPYMTSCGFSWA